MATLSLRLVGHACEMHDHDRRRHRHPDSPRLFLSCSVAVRNAAPLARVWQLLTDADHYTPWNSTLTSLEGPSVLGGVGE